MTWSLRTLGRVRVLADGEEVAGIDDRPARLALFIYLSVERNATVDRVVNTFWPDRAPDAARHNLNQALYELRELVGRGWVRRENETLVVGSEVSVDVEAFTEAMKNGDYDRALALYSGPFAGDVILRSQGPSYDRWVESRRIALHRQVRAAFRQSVAAARSRGEVEAVVEQAEAWVRMDPLDDEAQHALILGLHQTGRRADALRQFRQYEERLKLELEIEPLDHTRDLVRHIANGGPPDIDQAPGLLTPVAAQREESGERDGFPRIEGLEVLRQIGFGAAGEVYRAREPALGRLVAVKVLSLDLHGRGVALQRFDREALALARIRHPHIVTVHRVGTLPDGRPYIVMDDVRGTNLADRLAANGPRPVAEVGDVVRQIASALVAVHAEGFVHRDLCPANILYDEDREEFVLADFGVAGLLDEAGDSSTLTRTGERFGHPGYMSPEVAGGGRATDRSDMYALGVLAYELLHGRLPVSDLADQKENPGGSSSRLEEIIERCLEPNPLRRPNATDVLAAFDRHEAVAPAQRQHANTASGVGSLGSLLIAASVGAGLAALGWWLFG